MKLVQFLVAALLLVASPCLFADNKGPAKDMSKPIPFQVGFDCEAYSTPSCSGSSDSEIPEGMRFVIQYVSARVVVTDGNGVEITFTVGDPDVTVRAFKVPAYYSGKTSGGIYSIYSVSEKVLVFAERNETFPDVKFSAYSIYPDDEPIIFVQNGLITGYLEKAVP